MSPFAWAGVAVLGGGGAILRFLLDGLVSARAGRDLPFGTLTVNISGTFLLGLVIGIALTGDALVLVAGATLGSFTTFSTWMFETERLTEEGEGAYGVVNVTVSLAVGLGAIALGRFIGSHL